LAALVRATSMATRPPDWESYFEPRIRERTRELLEDFDVVGTRQHLAIVPRGEFLRHLRQNIRAAVVASTLQVNSIDYAKRRYCDEDEGDDDVGPAVDAYISAYVAAKNYINRLLKKLHTENLPDPTVGVFGASVVLERLPPSFFCAHLLYRLGHSYEGHAVSRLILEQIAWAYAAHTLDDMDAIEKIETTRAISQLKKFDSFAGEFYGFLSKKTHIDYASHREFLRVKDGQNVILHAHARFSEYGRTILYLADMFGLVWELSQLPYIQDPEAVIRSKEGARPNKERPFFKTVSEHTEKLERIEAVEREPRDGPTDPTLKATRRKRRAP